VRTFRLVDEREGFAYAGWARRVLSGGPGWLVRLDLVPALTPYRNQKTSNIFLECDSFLGMASWSFLTNHARVLLCIARDPGARLREIAASLGITERSAYGIVTDLAAAGYVVKQKDGRRNRYQIQAHLPLPETASREPAIGEVLAALMGDGAGRPASGHPA
jgi:MarR family